MIFTPNQVAEIIVETITGRVHKCPKTVHISKNPHYDLCHYDLAFPMEIQHWRGYVELNTPFLQSLRNILDYSMHNLLGWTEFQSDKTIYLDLLRTQVNDLKMH
ncbi:hypothetical protein TSAR_012862 [Trichomalopsis sarcophagae]|uniref:Uncharacterized protein n=1 Tax=Trichomalopsis sarcophagae TaxID=543379 RepID=A0A232FBY0_9HYME|nr:hypothetical protein TSAR_012862 [Trichomalopsis sarcophagae]